jgi:Mg-chelatase subunit ChlD
MNDPSGDDLAGRAAGSGQEILYRLARRPLHGRPGQHRSRALGPGLDPHGFAPLATYPDARRLDLHLSSRDPFGQWIVRLPRQRSSTTLIVIGDVSASMAFGQAPRKQDMLADLVDALGHSAWRSGDAFGFIGADRAMPEQWMLAPTRSRGATVELARRLRGARLDGRGAEAIRLAADRFGRRRDALVFLVSDFHWPQPDFDATCGALASRDVVPVVLWARHEFEAWPRRGLAEVQDLESGERRTIWFRPALADRMARAGAQRRTELRRRFALQGWRAFFSDGTFEASALNAYFHGEDRA